VIFDTWIKIDYNDKSGEDLEQVLSSIYKSTNVRITFAEGVTGNFVIISGAGVQDVIDRDRIKSFEAEIR